jgi:hypothetical protein
MRPTITRTRRRKKNQNLRQIGRLAATIRVHVAVAKNSRSVASTRADKAACSTDGDLPAE